MLGINLDDVKTVIGLMKNHLIAAAIVLVLAIAATIAVINCPKQPGGWYAATRGWPSSWHWSLS